MTSCSIQSAASWEWCAVQYLQNLELFIILKAGGMITIKIKGDGSMHKHLKDMGDIELFEEEVAGPALVGTVEYEHEGRHEFYGADIRTSHRMMRRICRNEHENNTRE